MDSVDLQQHLGRFMNDDRPIEQACKGLAQSLFSKDERCRSPTSALWLTSFKFAYGPFSTPPGSCSTRLRGRRCLSLHTHQISAAGVLSNLTD
jgi:hypothetical protein